MRPTQWPHGCGPSSGRRRDRHGECGAQHNDAVGLHSTTPHAPVPRGKHAWVQWRVQPQTPCCGYNLRVHVKLNLEIGELTNALYARAMGLFSWFAVRRSPPMPCHTYASASLTGCRRSVILVQIHFSIGLFVVHHHPLFRYVASRASLRRSLPHVSPSSQHPARCALQDALRLL